MSESGQTSLIENRTAWRIVAALLLLYALGFFVYYPEAITINDEGSYVRQTRLVMQGSTTETLVDPFDGSRVEVMSISHYPLGTALLMLPWMALGGWSLTFLAPLLCFVAGVGITASWLARAGHSPLFALLVLGYPPALVLGRVAMSDAPSLLFAAAGLWLFWRGLAGAGGEATPPADRARWWLASGLVAGAGLLLREGSALLFIPLFAGALIRRDRRWWALLIGGLCGVGLRLLAHQLYFGDALYLREPLDFGLRFVPRNIPIYGLALFVFVPGGLLIAPFYRGRRRPEILTTIALIVGFQLVYEYSATESGLFKRLILGPRFFISLLPMLAFAMAEALPRLASDLRRRRTRRAASPGGLDAALRAAIVLWCVGLAAAAVGVHVVHGRWGQGQAVIREAIYANTPDRSLLLLDPRATGKFVDAMYGDRTLLPLRYVTRSRAVALLERYEAFYVILLERSDSPFWRKVSFDNSVLLSRYRPRPKEQLDLRINATERLRVYRVSEVRAR